MKTFLKNTNWFSKIKVGKKSSDFWKDFEIRNQKDLIESYFEKDVVKKIWLVLRRCDWEDMIWKIF